VLGLSGLTQKGFPTRFEIPQFVHDGKFDLPNRENGYCFYDFNRAELNVGDQGVNCFLGNSNQVSTRVLLYGDSFAAQWEPYFEKLANINNIRIQSVSTNWCHPSFDSLSNAPLGHVSTDQCQFNRDWLKNNAKNYDLIFLGGAWSWIEATGISDGALEAVEQLLNVTDAKIVILGAPLHFERLSVENAIYNNQLELVPLEKHQVLNKTFRERLVSKFNREERIEALNLASTIAEEYKTADGYPYSLDGSHISIYGAEALFAANCANQQCRAFDLLNELETLSTVTP